MMMARRAAVAGARLLLNWPASQWAAAAAGPSRGLASSSAEGDNAGHSREARPGAGDRAAGGTTHFGYREVPLTEKTGLVRGVFDAVAPQYDLMNDVMSAGLHRLWKDRLVSTLSPFAGMVHLDLAGGTGDVAARVLAAIRAAERRRGPAFVPPAGTPRPPPAPFPPPGRVIVVDINGAMLAVGRSRHPDPGLSWLVADAESLPLDSASVDAVTIAFGLRNVSRPALALAEVTRVLKPGGRFLCLEFSAVDPLLRPLYDAYSFGVIPAVGWALAGDSAPYRYLVESIRRWPGPEVLAGMMDDAGMGGVGYDRLAGGVVAIHTGYKL